MGATITKIEYFLPETILTNDDLKHQFCDYDFVNFENKVGIKSRHVVNKNETALDLAIKACEKIFNDDTLKRDIDFVLYCSQSPEYFLPTTACILQDRLKLNKNIGALDFNLGCSGYTYGLSLAKGLIQSNQAKKVLLVTAETYSKFIHPEDRTNRSIFGDAAVATLISHSIDNNIGDFLFGTDGSGFDKLIVKNGGARNDFDLNCKIKDYGTGNKYTDNHLYMNGPEVFNFTAGVIPKFTKELLIKNNLKIDNVDQFIFHQASKYVLDKIYKNMNLDKSKIFENYSNYGNTVSASIPIALKLASKKKILKNNDKIVLTGFGVGLSWGSVFVKWKKID